MEPGSFLEGVGLDMEDALAFWRSEFSDKVLVKMWKSDEELGWEDYQSGDKGGPTQGNQSAGGAASLFGQSSANLFSSSSTSNPFASKPSGFSSSGFGSTVSSPAFTSLQSLTPFSPFGSTSSTSFLFSSQSPAFTSTTPSMFSTTGSSTFGLSNSLFGTSLAQGTTNTFGPSPNFSNSQSLPFFHSSTPSMPPSSSPFGQSMSFFGQTTSAFQNAFNPPSSGFGGNMFASTPSFGQTNGESFQSISAMPAYNAKSHEELRWEDYQSGDKVLKIPFRIFRLSDSAEISVTIIIKVNSNSKVTLINQMHMGNLTTLQC